MDFWLDRGVDGLRLDAVGYLIKRNGIPSRGLPETHARLRRIRAHVDAKYGDHVALLGEVHQPLADMRKYFGTGDECHLLYHFLLMEQLLLALARGNDWGVRDMLRASSGIPSGCQWAAFLRNHDEISLATLSQEEREELLQFIDPKGIYPFNNGKTASVRLASILPHKSERILDAFRLLYALPYATVMYYGDELGQQNLPVREGVRDTRIYVRGEFDWQEAERQMSDPDSLFNTTARIIERA
jgi:maltose alpha-D-glucosyltransferase/alpha-amylase